MVPTLVIEPVRHGSSSILLVPFFWDTPYLRSWFCVLTAFFLSSFWMAYLKTPPHAWIISRPIEGWWRWFGERAVIKHHPILISQDNAGAKNPGLNILLLFRRSVSFWWFIVPHVKMEVIIPYPHSEKNINRCWGIIGYGCDSRTMLTCNCWWIGWAPD